MIKSYFPPLYDEVPDLAFKITPEIEKKLESYKVGDGTLMDAVEHGKQYQRQNAVDTGESVYHPKHYNSHPSGVEAITIAEHFSFSLGNVIKYIFRAGLKENNIALTDLKKAKFYLDHEIERLSKK